AWRGPTAVLPLDLSLHLFDARERPSRQPEEAPGLGRALDVDRRGGELVAAWERRTRPGPLRLAGGAYLGRVEAAAGPNALAGTLDERSLFAEADWRPRWSRGVLSWGVDLAARGESAETGDLGWDRLRGELGLGVGYRDSSLRASWTAGRIGGDAPAWHLFQLGGVSSSLLPETVESARLLVPALPLGTQLGDELSAFRVDLDLDALPLPLFWGRYEVGSGLPGERALELAGAELRLRLGPVPLVRLPALDLTLGAAYVFDDPFADDLNAWIGLTWRP
ncbi:MAG TPA: hypothetical protein VHM02_00555, partial [Thermoanaerobaculia bacterium]|nr:hypothetical protein [Thermoanaerobaculia bacterium]